MTTVTIQLHDQDVRAAFDRLLANDRDLTPAMRAIGERLSETTKRRFETGTGPDGQRWAPNSRATYEALARKRGTFNKRDGKLSAKSTGLLASKKPLIGESKALSTTINYRPTATSVTIGSPMVYAAMQQFGGTKATFPKLWGDIPARPFLGLSAQDKSDILEILQDHLLGSVR